MTTEPTNDEDMPESPVNGLLSSAIATHMLWSSYVEAGFTPEQAMYLVGIQLAEATKWNLEHPTDG